MPPQSDSREAAAGRDRPLRWGVPHQSPSVTAVSLRLGHAAALTCPRQVIHHRGAASLPQWKLDRCGGTEDGRRGIWTRVADCHSRCAHRLRNDGGRGSPAAAGLTSQALRASSPFRGAFSRCGGDGVQAFFFLKMLLRNTMSCITAKRTIRMPRVTQPLTMLWAATGSSRSMGKPKTMAQGWW